MSTSPAPLPDAKACILLPSERFFVRTIPLDPTAEPSAQVELALESFSPFPLAQLYYGFLISSDRNEALVYATYRRRFSADDAEMWSTAETVLPAFVRTLGPPASLPALHLHESGNTLVGLAWLTSKEIPAVVLIRATDELTTEAKETFIGELRLRAHAPNAPLTELSQLSDVQFETQSRQLVFADGGDSSSLAYGSTQLATMDVRDKDELAALAQTRTRDRLLWRIFIGALSAVALAAVLELATLGAGLWLKTRQKVIERQQPAVAVIEKAQALSSRIDDLSGKRLQPLEMIALLNQTRPDGVLFLRVATSGLYTLEVEAQTKNSDEAGNYETALRSSGRYETVQLRDLRTRDGLTTFIVVATFRPSALQSTPAAK